VDTIESWRILLYPLGLLSGIAFGLRFIIQWLQSEMKGQSVVNASFWRFSLVGNFLLLAHSLIQIQFHVAVIQACNAVISWRNLNLLQKKHAPASFRTVISLLFLSVACVSILFILHDLFISNTAGQWFRIPIAPWQEIEAEDVPLIWHLMGFAGFALFSSRFWIQWWQAEHERQSRLSPAFWWTSLLGALLALSYSIRIQDTVNAIGPALGLIPYVRNLMLIKKAGSHLS
jgi:lipid-A-disaccharide synthase-like uncharacterized protein